MDYSDYILVGFGDCMTFGQGASEYTYEEHKSSIAELSQAHFNYAEDCNKNSYLKMLEEKMGFKTSINLALPGLSNERTGWYIENFLKNADKNKKYFILVGMSYTDRETLLVQNNDTHYPIDFWRGHAREDLLNKNKASNGKFNPAMLELKQSFWDDYYTHIKTKEKFALDYMKTFDNIYYMLASSRVKFLVFDMLSDFDYKVDRGEYNIKIVPTMHERNLIKKTNMPSLLSDTIKIFTERNRYRKYYMHYTYYGNEVVSNMEKYVLVYGASKGITVTECDGPVNKNGHQIICNKLSEHINGLY